MISETSAAEESVLALLSDLVFIAQQRPGSAWPNLARMANEHHSPPVDTRLLTPWHQLVQEECFGALAALVDVDIEAIERHFRTLRGVDKIDRHLPIGRLSVDDPIDADPALTIDVDTGETIIDLRDH